MHHTLYLPQSGLVPTSLVQGHHYTILCTGNECLLLNFSTCAQFSFCITQHTKSLPTTSSQYAQQFFDFAVAQLAWLQLTIQVIKYN